MTAAVATDFPYARALKAYQANRLSRSVPFRFANGYGALVESIDDEHFNLLLTHKAFIVSDKASEAGLYRNMSSDELMYALHTIATVL